MLLLSVFSKLGSCMIRDGRNRISQALEEFLLHGVKYAFPAVPSEVTCGLLTSFACAPLTKRRMPQVMNLLRRWRDGETHGIALESLYMTVPQRLSAIRFSTSHSPWSDAIRDGWARERKNGRETRNK
jgi:hypothetical protein